MRVQAIIHTIFFTFQVRLRTELQNDDSSENLKGKKKECVNKQEAGGLKAKRRLMRPCLVPSVEDSCLSRTSTGLLFSVV